MAASQGLYFVPKFIGIAVLPDFVSGNFCQRNSEICYRLRQRPPRILSAQANQFGLRKDLFDHLRKRFVIGQFAARPLCTLTPRIYYPQKRCKFFGSPFKLFLEVNLVSKYYETIGLACYQPHIGELFLFPRESNTNDVFVFHELINAQTSILPKYAILLVQI